MNDHVRLHRAVAHPVQLREELWRHRLAPGLRGRIATVNDWAATHLAVAFGLVWTVWLFMTIPLLVLLAPSSVRSVVFYLASGWIQLWALPLFVYVGNRLQRSSDAQSEVMHQALTHIATVSDQNVTLIKQDTDLTKQVHLLTAAQDEKIIAITAALDLDTAGGLADVMAAVQRTYDLVGAQALREQRHRK